MATQTKTDDVEESIDFEKKYRLETESKNQWDLRKRFLSAYWNKYDEDRLLSLARTYR